MPSFKHLYPIINHLMPMNWKEVGMHPEINPFPPHDVEVVPRKLVCDGWEITVDPDAVEVKLTHLFIKNKSQGVGFLFGTIVSPFGLMYAPGETFTVFPPNLFNGQEFPSDKKILLQGLVGYGVGFDSDEKDPKNIALIKQWKWKGVLGKSSYDMSRHCHFYFAE